MPLSPAEKEFLDGIIEESRDLDSPVLFLLHRIQNEYGWIKKDFAEYISKAILRPLTEIYAAVTFYDEFSTDPKGKIKIRVCRGIACHSKGSLKIIDAVRNRLGLSGKETTDDGRITLEEASCIGQCDGAPAMMINEKVYRNLDVEKAVNIVSTLMEREDD